MKKEEEKKSFKASEISFVFYLFVITIIVLLFFYFFDFSLTPVAFGPSSRWSDLVVGITIVIIERLATFETT